MYVLYTDTDKLKGFQVGKLKDQIPHNMIKL